MVSRNYSNFIHDLSRLIGGNLNPHDCGLLRLSCGSGVELYLHPDPAHEHLLLTAHVGHLPVEATHEHAAALAAAAGRWFLNNGCTLCCPQQTRQVVLSRADSLRPLQARRYLDQTCHFFADAARQWHGWLAGLPTGQALLEGPPSPPPSADPPTDLSNTWKLLKELLAADPDLGAVLRDGADDVTLPFIQDIEVRITPQQEDFLLTCTVPAAEASTAGSPHWDLLHANLWFLGPTRGSWWWDAQAEQASVGLRHAAQYLRFEELREGLAELVNTAIHWQQPDPQGKQEETPPLDPRIWA